MYVTLNTINGAPLDFYLGGGGEVKDLPFYMFVVHYHQAYTNDNLTIMWFDRKLEIM